MAESGTRRWLILATVAASLLCALSNSARRDLLIGDETRYAKIVDEMSTAGELAVPRLDGQHYSDKPPAFFWLIIALRALPGSSSEWALMLPSLLSFIGMTAIAWLLARHLFDSRAAIVAPLVFSTMYIAWVAGQIVRMDMVFAAALGAGFALLHAALENANRRLLFFAAIAFGAATLFKGPVAILLAVVFLLLTRRWRRFNAVTWMLALPIAFVPLAGWLGAAALSAGKGFIEELVMQQTVRRAVAATVHLQPPWFYAFRLPVILFPWFFPLAVAVAAFVCRDRDQWTPGERFLVDWMLSVLLTFSIISSKLDVYLLPMALPAAILLGAFAAREVSQVWTRRTRIGSAIAFLMILAGVAIVLLRERTQGLSRTMLKEPEVRTALVLCAATAIVAIVLLIRTRTNAGAITTLAAGTLITLILISVAAIPRVREIATAQPFLDVLSRYDSAVTIRFYCDDTYFWSEERRALSARIRYSTPEALRIDTATDDVVVAKESMLTAARLTEHGYRKVAAVGLRDRHWLVMERTDLASRIAVPGDATHEH